MLSMLFLLLPASQAAVQGMNYLTTNLLPAASLSKLDFSDGIPDDCKTLVAIPTLLLNEKQVRGLVEKLEVRFLGNHDPNLHFALVSDLPDSPKPAPGGCYIAKAPWTPHAVVDGNLVTGQQNYSAAVTADAVLKQLSAAA